MRILLNMSIHSLWLIPISIALLWVIIVGLTRLILDFRAYTFILKEIEKTEIDGVDTSNYEVYYTVNSGPTKPWLFKLIWRIYRKWRRKRD
jgi:hypothetical protein